jgi:hypothetical protein
MIRLLSALTSWNIGMACNAHTGWPLAAYSISHLLLFMCSAFEGPTYTQRCMSACHEMDSGLLLPSFRLGVLVYLMLWLDCSLPHNICLVFFVCTLQLLGTYQTERTQSTAPMVLGSMTSHATYHTELKVSGTYQNSRTMYQDERKQNEVPTQEQCTY